MSDNIERSKKRQVNRVNNPVIEADRIEDEAKSLRDKHHRITDKQHELVATMLQDGCTITEAANRMGSDRSWASKTLNKQHVMEYMRDLAMNAIGAHALRATHTMTKLLDAKSEKVRQEAAKDLMDRAGLGVSEAERAPPLSINISL